MPPDGHDAGAWSAIATTWFPMAAASVFAEHRHAAHQLVWASAGVVTVTIADRHWVLPASLALWVPAGTPHTTAAGAASLLGGVYLDPKRCPVRWTTPTVVAVPPVLAALLTHLADDRALGVAARRRAEAVVFDLLEPIDVATLTLPMPTDDRAARVANALRDRPDDGRTLAEWGALVGASGRTLARGFMTETGMTFGAWRTQLRLGAALAHLAAGSTVAAAGRAVGYSNPSAFIAAFRHAFGVSPGGYFPRGADRAAVTDQSDA